MLLKSNPYMKAYLNVINESISKASIIKRERIANEIGGIYISETNTIDCKGNKVKFKDNWLDENGSFNFKLINTSNDWSFMFYYCTNLIHLPDDFTIPNNVINCARMFYNCVSLIYLPNDFTIPESVTDCSFMFYDCVKLAHLPENFTIPESVKNCTRMFYNCVRLTYLSNNFTLPNSVTNCKEMFSFCTDLTQLPYTFHIPENSDYNDIFNGCYKLKNKNPEAYRMLEI